MLDFRGLKRPEEAVKRREFEKMCAAPQENENGTKLKAPDIRQEAYRQYCSHLAKGKSKKSFVFRHPEYSCHWQTIESYIQDKIEFDPIHKELAICEGYAKWEQIVEDSATGANKDANTASLQMLMRNKYDWDKAEKDENKYGPSERIRVVLADIKKLGEQTSHGS
jgi:hypothetical protein